MAQVFEAQGSLDRALSMLMEVEHRVMLRQDRTGQVMLYNTMGGLYTRKGDLKRAEESLDKAGRLLAEVPLPVQQRDNYKLLAELNIARGDYKQATRYYDKFITLNDTLFNARSATEDSRDQLVIPAGEERAGASAAARAVRA